MSIIQSIRDKATWAISIIIGLSLIGFLLMDAGKNGPGGFGGRSSSIGAVNGNKIEIAAYDKQVTNIENQYQQMGYPVNDMMKQNIREQAWNQLVTQNSLDEQVEKLGIQVSGKELDDYLFGRNPPQDFARNFTNEAGVFDANAARQAIANLRKEKTSEIAQNFNNEYLPALIKNRMQEKYASLITGAVYFPKWMAEKMNADNNSLAAVSFVNIPYTTISDSAAKVSDDEINEYVSKHKSEFKQEESRGIAYVAFDARPSSADTAVLLNQLENLKSEFASTPTTDLNLFLSKSGAQGTYQQQFVLKSKMQMPNADTIRSLQDGQVFGPYFDANTLTLAKMIAHKNMPDSVKVRHILIKIADRQNPQIRDDSTAKKLADSIATAIRGGADFDQLATKYNEDEGSKLDRPEQNLKKGEYEFASISRLVQPFYEVAFYEPAGTKKVVKAESSDYVGYHYMEVMSQKNFEPAFDVAYLAKSINPSQHTQDSASGLASQFASESRSAKAFDDNTTKHKYNKLLASDVKPNDIAVPGLGASRQLVKWIYEAEKGDVSEMFEVDDKYIVATVTEINKEGTMSAQKARPIVEYILRNQKKAEQIKKKIGTPASLEAVATANGVQVLRTDSLSFMNPTFPAAGLEGKVGGYAFNPSGKGKISAPIAGNSGVFVIKTDNVYAQSNSAGNADQQREAMVMNQRSSAAQRSIDMLRQAAKVKDERAKYY